MIDARVAFAPARDLIALDLWEGPLPDLAGVRALPVEPGRWWLIEAGDHSDAIAQAIGARGALTPFGGGMIRATLIGLGWRDLLSVSSFVDSERLAIGGVTSSVIHHVPMRLHPVDAWTCEVFCPASYASTLADLWRDAGAAIEPGETSR